MSVGEHWILIKIFASLLLYLHLDTRCRLPTLALRSGRVRCNIATVFLSCKVVGVAVRHPADLVLLGVVPLELVDRTSFVLLDNVVSVLVARAPTQPAELVLGRWIPDVFFILILDDYFTEEVVLWVLAALLLSERVRLLQTSVEIALFI